MENSAHINNIRNFMRDGQQPGRAKDGRQYFDSVAFWQAKYKKSLEVENELRARILDLEAMLEARTDASSGTIERAVVPKNQRTRGGSTLATRKRKRGTVDDRATKLARTTENSEGLHTRTLCATLLDIDLDLEVDRHANSLLDHIYRIRSAINGGDNRSMEAKELKHLVIQTAADIGHVIVKIKTLTVIHAKNPPRARRPTLPTQEDEADLEATELIADMDKKCVIVARFFPSLLRALATLPDTPNYRGEAIHSLTSIFKCLLERISPLSAPKARRDSLKGAPRKEAGTTRGRLLAEISDYLPEPVHRTGEVDDRVIKKLCQLAFSMMDSLDPNHSTEKEIFEGFLYYLLNCTGALLNEFTFNHERFYIPKDTQDEERRAKLEAQAPYIIYLLKHATTVTAKQFGLDTDFRQPFAEGESRIGRIILPKARKILQNTLLKAVYGEDAKEYAESLKKPLEACANSCLDSGPSQIDGEMQTTSQWFKNEVWQTVGCDLLYNIIEFK